MRISTRSAIERSVVGPARPSSQASRGGSLGATARTSVGPDSDAKSPNVASVLETSPPACTKRPIAVAWPRPCRTISISIRAGPGTATRRKCVVIVNGSGTASTLAIARATSTVR